MIHCLCLTWISQGHLSWAVAAAICVGASGSTMGPILFLQGDQNRHNAWVGVIWRNQLAAFMIVFNNSRRGPAHTIPTKEDVKRVPQWDPPMKKEDDKRYCDLCAKKFVTSTMLLGYTLRVFVLSTFAAAQPHKQNLNHSIWDELSDEVEGRLFPLKPFSEPCFSQPFNSSGCTQVRNDYRDECMCNLLSPQTLAKATLVARTQHPGAYIQLQWETCQQTSAGCLLDSLGLNSTDMSGKRCSQGSVSTHYAWVILLTTLWTSILTGIFQIEVQKPSDISAAFMFSRTTKIPLVIKNTGVRFRACTFQTCNSTKQPTAWLHGTQ